MRTLFISFLLLALVGCAHSNSASHVPALHYRENKALGDQNWQKDLSDPNHRRQNIPYLDPYPYTILDW